MLQQPNAPQRRAMLTWSSTNFWQIYEDALIRMYDFEHVTSACEYPVNSQHPAVVSDCRLEHEWNEIVQPN